MSAGMPFYFSGYLILPLLSAVVNTGLAMHAWRHRALQPVARPLFWLMVGMAGWSWIYALNTASTTLPLKYFFFKMGVSFCTLIAPAFLAMALETIGRGYWLTRCRFLLLCGVPALSLVLTWTNDLHFLVRTDMQLVNSGPLLVLGFRNGPYFPIHVAYIILANVLALGCFFSAFRTLPREEWPRFILLIVATLLPLSVQIFQLTPVKGFEMTTSSLFITGILYSMALFRHNLLDIVPLARAALFAQIGEPVLVLDLQGTLVDCNETTRLLANTDTKQPLAQVFSALMTRFPELLKAFHEPAKEQGETMLYSSPCGERCWRIASSPVVAAGTVRGQLVLLHDISDLKQVEKKLIESQHQLRELNSSLVARVEEETKRRMDQERLLANNARLAAMGEMIGAIAHQWRQPLSTLGMIVQRTHAMGTLQGITTEALDEFKTNAMRQIRYMSDTIEEFRGFYRFEKHKELFSPGNCVAAALRLLESQFVCSGIAVEITGLECNQHLAYGYPNAFKQVVLNLLANARDAIVGRKTLGTPQIPGRLGIAFSLAEYNTLHIDISDNGCGIAKNVVPMIFDPYFTTKEAQGGNGIGLYMAKMIMENRLKGELSLLRYQDGTTFRISLPIKEHPCTP